MCCRLRLEHARFSPFKSAVSVTLVTTYDISRLHMLDGLCSSWGGHLSAAVYQVRGLRGRVYGVRELAPAGAATSAGGKG